MPKAKVDIYLQAVRELWKYKLMDGKRKLLMTSGDREWLLEVKKEFALRYPDKKYEVGDFGVHIIRMTASQGVLTWKKIEGEYSLWEIMQWRLD